MWISLFLSIVGSRVKGLVVFPVHCWVPSAVMRCLFPVMPFYLSFFPLDRDSVQRVQIESLFFTFPLHQVRIAVASCPPIPGGVWLPGTILCSHAYKLGVQSIRVPPSRPQVGSREQYAEVRRAELLQERLLHATQCAAEAKEQVLDGAVWGQIVD